MEQNKSMKIGFAILKNYKITAIKALSIISVIESLCIISCIAILIVFLLYFYI